LTFVDKLRRSWQAALATSLSDLFWYGILAAAVWVCFHSLLRRAMAGRRLMRYEPTRGQIAREILHSVRSIAIFGLVAAVVVFAAISGWTRIYIRIERFGWTWFVLSIGVMIVLHDAYFYWTHRLMHHRRLYRLFHKTHHLSTSPTPWAAYAFSPLEALVQAGIGPLIIFTIPVHPLAFATFMMWQITFNVLGHSGYEIFPRWLLSSHLGLFINSITHHAQHHEKFRANYGLYFNVWDRLMGTNHREYAERFAEVTGGADRANAAGV
jgi:sterol desaturase/sphingolipid hydroxylase (fatty acid hydroxylase superfamily)